MIDTKELREKITTMGLDVVADTDILVVIDRLEAAESEAIEQARLNGMGGEREAALLAKLEAAEKERDNANAAAVNIALEAERLQCENDNLRAKIEAMERQEPVATVIKEGDSRYWMSERLWTFPDGKYPLYALPGAQSVPDVDALAQLIREIDGKHQLGAGALAERIVEWLAAAPEAKPCP